MLDFCQLSRYFATLQVCVIILGIIITHQLAIMDAKDASKMLEAALQQMDGIISSASNKQQQQQGGSGGGGGSDVTVGAGLPHQQQHQNKSGISMTPGNNGSGNILNERSVISNSNVLSTAKTLAMALQQVYLVRRNGMTSVIHCRYLFKAVFLNVCMFFSIELRSV